MIPLTQSKKAKTKNKQKNNSTLNFRMPYLLFILCLFLFLIFFGFLFLFLIFLPFAFFLLLLVGNNVTDDLVQKRKSGSV